MEGKESDDKTLKGLIERIRLELSGYLETRLELFKLEAYEKGSIAGSYIVFGLIVAFIALLLVIFVLATVAIAIAVATKSLLAGFISVTGLVAVMLVVLIANGNRIRNRITNSVLSIIRKIEKDE